MSVQEDRMKSLRRRRRPASNGGLGYSRSLNASSRPISRTHSLGRKADTALERFNDAQEERFLHPTKGWRKLNVKRGKAQAIMSEIFEGRRMSMQRMAKILA